jgi:hypothetical protein
MEMVTALAIYFGLYFCPLLHYSDVSDAICKIVKEVNGDIGQAVQPFALECACGR